MSIALLDAAALLADARHRSHRTATVSALLNFSVTNTFTLDPLKLIGASLFSFHFFSVAPSLLINVVHHCALKECPKENRDRDRLSVEHSSTCFQLKGFAHPKSKDVFDIHHIDRLRPNNRRGLESQCCCPNDQKWYDNHHTLTTVADQLDTGAFQMWQRNNRYGIALHILPETPLGSAELASQIRELPLRPNHCRTCSCTCTGNADGNLSGNGGK
ncbi:hypothetical protein T02_11392 [Trichinella nativa]|uniref:Uncharacterized protein n=1 Tax=Trichinella nativa TaxID=6335 RepID=A0A0V1LLU5_9BILA|nr:hypothetical protein T02_11392 [Trichinella nativa]